MHTNRAQTATEYLIITAVVIVIALVVVSLLGGIPGLSSGIPDQQKILELQFEKVASSSIAVTDSGTFLTLANNHGSTMRIEQVWINGLSCVTTDIRFPHQLGVGQNVQITCVNAVSSVIGSGVPDVNVIWTEVSTSASYTTYQRQDQMKSQECFWADNLTDCMEFYVKNGCGTGTVLHTLSGLCWQADLNASFSMNGNANINWTNAILYCENLVLCSDGTWDGNFSSAGTCSGSMLHDDWYLPSLNEWSTVRDLATGGAPYIVGSDGDESSTLFDNYPTSGTRWYWTSSGGSSFAWFVGLNNGRGARSNQDPTYRAVCSRWNN